MSESAKVRRGCCLHMVVVLNVVIIRVKFFSFPTSSLNKCILTFFLLFSFSLLFTNGARPSLMLSLLANTDYTRNGEEYLLAHTNILFPHKYTVITLVPHTEALAPIEPSPC